MFFIFREFTFYGDLVSRVLDHDIAAAMGSRGDESKRGTQWRIRLFLLWSLLATPLVTAYDSRFCSDYYESACRAESDDGIISASDTICKCFFKGTALCCNLDGEVGTLDPVMMGPYKSVLVSNASSIVYTPLCGTYQKLTFDKVDDGKILQNEKFAGMDCLVDFKAVDSTVDNALAFNKVQLDTSSIETIGHSTVLTDLILDRSRVNTVENLTMARTSLEKTECLSFDNSHISNISNILVMCDTHIDKTRINQISGSDLYRSRISSSEIGLVEKDGLTLQHGWHKMINVTIHHLQEKALTLNTYTKIDLINLEIVQCDMPCIVSKTDFVHFKNLIINGNKIEDIGDTPYISVLDPPVRTVFDSSSPLCSKVGTALECRSGKDTKYRAMEFQPDFSYPETKFSQFSLSLGLTSHCFKELKLEEVNGWVRNLHPEGLGNKDQCPYSNRRIVIKDCELIDYLQSDYLDQLDMDFSEIEYLDISTALSKVDISRVTIHDLENMKYSAREGVKSNFNLKTVTIASVYNLLLKSPGLMTDLKVLGRVSNFTVDTLPDDTTTIRGGTLRSVTAQGIHIKSGILVLDNVRIYEMAYGAITLENRGRLVIIPSSDLLDPFVCEKGPRIIAQRKSQVVFVFPMHKPHWLRDCTLTRDDDLEEMEDLKTKFPRFVTQKDCIIDEKFHAVCNMSNAQGPTLLGGTSAMDSAVTVDVTGSANLTVGDHCFDEVKLEGVKSADIMGVKNSCYFKLILTDKTSILNVVNNVYDLKVVQSSIRKLASSATLERVEVSNSSIRSFSATIRKGLFQNVTIKDISTLKVLNEVEFINCNLAKFFKGSVEVRKGGILRFKNCSMSMMSARSFMIRGSVQLINVTINVAENETLSMDRDAFVTMEGVSFRKQVSNLFSIDSPPHILLNYVTMNKIPVKLDKRFDVAISYLNGTIVGQGHKNDRCTKCWFCFDRPSFIGTALAVLVLTVVVAVGSWYGGRTYRTKEELEAQKQQRASKDGSAPGSGTPSEAPGTSTETTSTDDGTSDDAAAVAEADPLAGELLTSEPKDQTRAESLKSEGSSSSSQEGQSAAAALGHKLEVKKSPSRAKPSDIELSRHKGTSTSDVQPLLRRSVDSGV